jgi:hypothetical protein
MAARKSQISNRENQNRSLKIEKKPPDSRPAGRERSFYARVLDEAEKIDFETAAGVDGIDDEIAIMRIKIREILANDPDNIRLLMAASEQLTKMVKARYKMDRGQKNGLKEGIRNIIRDIAVPIGVAVLKDKLPN